MGDLNAYLERHYLTAEQLAANCSISTSELASLVAEKLVPHASYTVDRGDTLVSQAFGKLLVRNAAPGQYYHPGNAHWIKLALEETSRSGPQGAHRELKKRFKGQYAAALRELNDSTFRLPDSFTDDGEEISASVDLRTEAAWNYFVDGVFSLCVADPSTEESIALKEILQEALVDLTDDGSRADYSAEEKRRILSLIDRYALAAMPFSPVEYPLSSRKRLVEDLRRKLDQT
jgi:uncharacterized protein YdbL (DUF1318 family)